MRISSAVIVRHSCGPSNCRGQAFGRNTRMHEGSSPGWAETGRPSRLAVARVRLSAEALAAIRSLLDIKSVLPGSNLARVRKAWDEWQAKRDRDAIYCSLTAVFDLVVGDGKTHFEQALRALQLQHLDLPTSEEPFAAIILATADRQKVDKRTRSKWSRVLRYAAKFKTDAEPLAAFVRHQHADPPHSIRLLRMRCERPRRRCTTEQRDELASSDESCHLIPPAGRVTGEQ